METTKLQKRVKNARAAFSYAIKAVTLTKEEVGEDVYDKLMAE